MAQKICPYCGAPVDPNRNACPNCRKVLKAKSPLTPYLIIAILVVVVIIVVAVLLANPVQGPAVTTVTPSITASPATGSEVSVPSQPTCTIGITGTRVSSATIRLQVISTTCSAGEVSSLSVSINGAAKGTLGSGPGASADFSGSLGTDSVIVTAKFANGAESVVYRNP